MLRSLFSGVSGLKNNQIKLDVIGNNIANVNTTAYKSGRVRFQDIFSQKIKDASAPADSTTDGLGGINPRQIGLGMQVAAIDTITTQGSPQPTGRDLDLSISGNGYFVLSDGSDKKYYTRDGAFYLDTKGNLVNSDGYYVLDSSGTAITIASPDTISNLTIAPDGQISYIDADGTLQEDVSQIGIATFSNPEGLSKAGGNKYEWTNNASDAEPDPGAPGADNRGYLQQYTLEMSNVDLANEFTEMIITSRAYQANSRTITTSDEMLQELLNLKR